MYKLFSYILLLGLTLITSSTTIKAQKKAMNRANKFFQQKEYAKALEIYTKEASPTNNRVLYNKGTTLLRLYHPKESMTALERSTAQEKNPWYKSQGYHNEGVIFQAQRNYDQAIECYKNALRNNPNDEHARYNLALCKYLKENGEQEEQAMQQPEESQQSEEQTEMKVKQNEISNDNIDQLLNISKQEEQKTQNKIKQQQVIPQTKKLKKNW